MDSQVPLPVPEPHNSTMIDEGAVLQAVALWLGDGLELPRLGNIRPTDAGPLGVPLTAARQSRTSVRRRQLIAFSLGSPVSSYSWPWLAP